ncbi:MAG TPA: hypothetical protein P5186_01575 [Candidatus Paceibacterota bacterium]|nr:hypothetical protein [Verrucomicrobiota bacterium]HRY46712.1 hypothetical protein [Candidatus Paceibacterota bacterium]
MRHFVQTDVLKRSACAALITAALCYPRFSLWFHRSQPLWYMESMVFVSTIILWAGVFAWHTRYCHRPVFILRWDPKNWAGATLAALLMAAALYFWLDPSLRQRTPQDYPAHFEQWAAMVLFHLVFVQLFLVFAPFAWSIRLFRDPSIATALTVAFGMIILLLKIRWSPMPYPGSLIAVLVLLRIVIGLLSVLFYLRGGAILVWWWAFLVEARHLLNLDWDAPSISATL